MIDVAAARAIAEDFTVFCRTFGARLYTWQAEAFGAAFERKDGRFCSRLCAVSAPRGNGKTWPAALGAIWRFRFGPQPQTVLSVGLHTEGAKIITEYARRFFRDSAVLAEGVDERAGGFVIPAVGSRWIIRSREDESSRGEHPDLVTYDEVGMARDDQLFSSLLASQASVIDPLMLLTSTVGPSRSGPLWRLKEMAEAGEPEVYFYHTSENLSPRVTPQFLERQKRLLLPLQYAREHLNSWTDSVDAFVSASEVDDAVGGSDGSWAETYTAKPGVRYTHALDIGLVHDVTAYAIGHAEAELVYIDRILTVQGSHARPVQLATIERMVRELTEQFRAEKVLVESWQGIGLTQSLQRLGLPVVVKTPTMASNGEEWSRFAQLLASRRIVLPPDPALREELLNLSYSVGPSGIRVVDRGRVHQDRAVVCRMIGAALAVRRPDFRIL